MNINEFEKILKETKINNLSPSIQEELSFSDMPDNIVEIIEYGVNQKKEDYEKTVNKLIEEERNKLFNSNDVPDNENLGYSVKRLDSLIKLTDCIDDFKIIMDCSKQIKNNRLQIKSNGFFERNNVVLTDEEKLKINAKTAELNAKNEELTKKLHNSIIKVVTSIGPVMNTKKNMNTHTRIKYLEEQIEKEKEELSRTTDHYLLNHYPGNIIKLQKELCRLRGISTTDISEKEKQIEEAKAQMARAKKSKQKYYYNKKIEKLQGQLREKQEEMQEKLNRLREISTTDKSKLETQIDEERAKMEKFSEPVTNYHYKKLQEQLENIQKKQNVSDLSSSRKIIEKINILNDKCHELKKDLLSPGLTDRQRKIYEDRLEEMKKEKEDLIKQFYDINNLSYESKEEEAKEKDEIDYSQPLPDEIDVYIAQRMYEDNKDSGLTIEEARKQVMDAKKNNPELYERLKKEYGPAPITKTPQDINFDNLNNLDNGPIVFKIKRDGTDDRYKTLYLQDGTTVIDYMNNHPDVEIYYGSEYNSTDATKLSRDQVEALLGSMGYPRAIEEKETGRHR